MAVSNLSQIGASGIQTGLEQAQRAALDIARVGTTAGNTNGDGASSLADLTEASVDLLEAKNQVQANAKVVATGNEVLGTIIDTIA